MQLFTSEHYQTVVEVGASSDYFLRHIDAERKIGVNISYQCIAQLKEQGIEAVQNKDESIPLPDSFADVVLCYETLEHVKNPLAFLLELERITKYRLLLSIPWVAKTQLRMKGTQGDSHVWELDESDFLRLLSYSNFKVRYYQKLINYDSGHNPIVYWVQKRYMHLSWFPAIQAYVLEKGNK